MLILVLLATGCAGNYGIFKRQTRSESKTTKQQLIDNWSDYDIWYRYHPVNKSTRLTIIIFDTKNDDMKILVEGNWSKVKDQEMWTEIVKENTARTASSPWSGTIVGPITLQASKRYGVPTTSFMDLLSIRHMRCHWEE